MTPGSRRAIAGFLVSGLLLSFTGAILPAWGYHLRPNYGTIGNYFLAVTLGVLVAFRLSRVCLVRKGVRFTLVLACLIAFAAFVSLSLTPPPIREWWRVPGLVGLGVAAGLLQGALFHAISDAYELNPAATVNLAGVAFGLGSLMAAFLIAGTFHLYTVPVILFLFALVPAGFALVFARTPFQKVEAKREGGFRGTLEGLNVYSAILIALLLFFQFGNEWAIAGWLPLFLIQRLGMSPARALYLLSLYWVAIIVGRIAVQALVDRFSHTKMLLTGVIAALFGCLILTFTNNLFGAILAALLIGFGFAPIYPLSVEKIGKRFPAYHPAFFNGVFSVAVIGGMLAPATLGYAGEFLGIRVMTALPAIGTFIVLVLVLLIWAEAKLTEWMAAKEGQ